MRRRDFGSRTANILRGPVIADREKLTGVETRHIHIDKKVT
jgi:hypothetical protein